MAQYSIWRVTPMNYSHTQAFDHLAIALESGLKELGHDCITVTNYWDAKGKCIILGANLLHTRSYFPENPIIFNLEQITPGSPWLTDVYVELLKKFPVWDYSVQNILELEKLGIRAELCKIGYAPELTRIPKRLKEETDVLFVGSMNERRMKLCNELAKHCDVVAAYNKYGDELDHLISKSKIVLNLHFYEAKIFEIVRCSYLMANKKCIVSEFGEDDDLEQPFYGSICFADYDEIIDKCLMLLKDDSIRNDYENKGFETFSQMKQSEYLKEIL